MYRYGIQPGDIVFTRSNTLFFKLTRLVTKGDFGHVLMGVGQISEHTLVVEATSKSGVDVNDFVWKVLQKEGYIVYRLRDVMPEAKQLVIDTALSWVGTKYDKSPLLNFIIGRTWFGTDKQVYCSELIYRVLIQSGFLENVQSPEMISPADLRQMVIKSDKFSCVFDHPVG